MCYSSYLYILHYIVLYTSGRTSQVASSAAHMYVQANKTRDVKDKCMLVRVRVLELACNAPRQRNWWPPSTPNTILQYCISSSHTADALYIHMLIHVHKGTQTHIQLFLPSTKDSHSKAVPDIVEVGLDTGFPLHPPRVSGPLPVATASRRIHDKQQHQDDSNEPQDWSHLGGREERREGGREGGMEREREGRREGGMEREREGRREERGEGRRDGGTKGGGKLARPIGLKDSYLPSAHPQAPPPTGPLMKLKVHEFRHVRSNDVP